MKRFLKVSAFVFLIFQLLGGIFWGVAFATFSDIKPSTPYADAILYAQKYHLVTGYPDGSFRPFQHINRAEFNKILIKAALNYDPAKDSSGFGLTSLQGLPFSDLQKGAWYNPYFRQSYQQKIISGYPDGSMRPGNDISFAEAAKMSVLAFGYSVKSAPIWYQPYVDKLAELKAIPPTITSFHSQLTRAEMVEIIYRLQQHITTRPSLDSTLKSTNTGLPPSLPAPAATPGPTPALSALPHVGNCQIFPSDNPWNRDISKDPLDPNSAQYMKYIAGLGGNQFLHPDVGGNGQWGIPYTVVDGHQPKVPIDIFDYPDQSDPGPYPIPLNAAKENGPDGHVIVVDKDHCFLYELYEGTPTATGWKASVAATFDLSSNRLRPDTWTSTDAAGLPVFAGLFRYDEVNAGAIHHALRVSMSKTQQAFIHPATHYASKITDPNAPPMGLRLRLKASYDISKFSGSARVLLEAMKHYGLIVADNGSNWFFTGATDTRWNDDELNTLKSVPGSAFEVVQSGPVIKGY